MPAVESIRFKVDRASIARFPAALQRFAIAQTDGDLRRRLLQACAKFDGWLSKPGDKIRLEAPVESWRWLCNQCTTFDSCGFGSALSQILVEHDSRAEKARNLEALEKEAVGLAEAAHDLRIREGV